MKRLTSNIEGLSARQLAQRCIGAEELSNGRERKLALEDDILMSVSSPARYVGGEVNSVMKTLTPGMVRFAMCFPDVYEIGMSHLGIQILYDMFNRYDDVWCERVYSPWLDLDKIMREKKIPLFALESQEPVKNFDFLGITLQYEMCYTNVLQVLDLSGCTLDSVLYYPDREIPVLAMLGDGNAVLIIGFNEKNVVLMNPETDKVYKMGMNDAADWFTENGCHFISYVKK